MLRRAVVALTVLAAIPAAAQSIRERQSIGERAVDMLRVAPRPFEGPRDGPTPAPMPPAKQGFLKPDDVASALSGGGFAPSAPPRRRGDYYVVEARNPRGEPVDVVVNAVSGVVEGLRRRPPR